MLDNERLTVLERSDLLKHRRNKNIYDITLSDFIFNHDNPFCHLSGMVIFTDKGKSIILKNRYTSNEIVSNVIKSKDEVIFITDDSISDEEKKVYIVDEILTTNDEYCFLYSKNTDDTYQYCAKISELKKIK